MDSLDDRRPGPLVSVVFPCYNSHAYFQQALDSVRSQTFQDFEIIVVDDGSDNSETIAFLDSLGEDVRLVRQRNYGLPAARNAGIRVARGTYVLPLDCDDWLDPAFLESACQKIQQLPPRSFVFSYLKLHGDLHGTVIKEYNYFEQLFLNQIPYCVLMPREIWYELGGYDESMRRGYEDWEFNVRLGRHGIFGQSLDEALFNYRVSKKGMLKSVSIPRHGQLWRDIQKKNCGAYGLGPLVSAWWTWRARPSTYYLWLYFIWLAIHRILPRWAFRQLFQHLMPYSHSSRVSRKTATT